MKCIKIISNRCTDGRLKGITDTSVLPKLDPYAIVITGWLSGYFVTICLTVQFKSEFVIINDLKPNEINILREPKYKQKKLNTFLKRVKKS